MLTVEAVQTAGLSNHRSFREGAHKLGQKYGIWFIFLLVVVVASVTIPDFRDVDNLTNILKQAGVLGILAIGQTFVIVAGLVDLSVGMAAGLVVVMTCAITDGSGTWAAPVILLMLAGGLCLGGLNGYLIERLKVHSVIFTFGMLSILQGLIFTYTDSTVGSAPTALKSLANDQFLGIPNSAILLAVVSLFAHCLLTHSRFGYHLMAAGGSPQSAARAGVNVFRLRVWAFALSGLCAALAGLLLAGRLGTGYPLAGSGLELDAVVAVVLGGTALMGGRGSVLNSVGGVLTLTVISNALNLLEISSFVQMFLKGAIVVLAILANRARQTQQ